ncbi:MAG: T9SS type A sorting domain-containing protein, partial [Spirochaetaceae bacterium]|nr:T9SS type A sorting domain-containing protein [Spirochaetaceae bacterium]
GTANTTDVTGIPLNRALYGWNLVGNPYSSAINATVTADALNNILTVNSASLDPSFGAIYMWDAASSTYLTISNAGGTLSQHYIQAGQGFFMRAILGGSTIDITRAMQAHQPTVSMLKSSPATWPAIRVFAESEDLESSTFISFNSEMTTGLDITYDAGMHKSNPDFALYSRLVEDNGIDFAIQCLPDNIAEMEIPLGLDAPLGTTVTFRADIENWPLGGSLLLKDRSAGKSIDLLAGESYSFEVSASNSVAGNFFLHTTFIISGFEETAVKREDPYTVIANRAAGTIRIMGSMSPSSRARLIDLSGRVRADVPLENTYENVIYISDLENGIYLLQIQNNNKLSGKKIWW